MHVLPEQWVNPLVSSSPSRTVSASKGNATAHKKATTFDAIAFGVNLVLSGVFYGWTGALERKYSIVLSAYFMVSAGYTALAFCIAEVASLFPFGGGSFGFARCIIRPSVGFVVGITEAVEYLFVVTSTLSVFGGLCTTVAGTSPDLEPVWWTVFFAVSIAIQACGGTALWMATRGLFFMAVGSAIFYFFSVVPVADIHAYTALNGSEPSSTQGLVGFMHTLPILNWVFVGLEALVLATEDVEQPTIAVPKATLWAWGILFVLSTSVLLVSTTSAPGSVVLAGEISVLSPGLSHVYGWTTAAATIISLPCAFAAPFSFLFVVSKLLAAMAASKVLPSFLGKELGPNRTPIAGLLTSSGIVFTILMVARKINPALIVTLLNACLLASCFVYVVLAACFCISSSRYSSLQRQYRSPLGVYGAATCALVFTLVFIGLAFFQDDLAHFGVFMVFQVLSVTAYALVVRRYEFFSDDEVNTFMKAYVINANLRRKEEIKKKAKKRMVSTNNRQRSGISNGQVRTLPQAEVLSSARLSATPGEMIPLK